jgi:cysteine synthase
VRGPVLFRTFQVRVKGLDARGNQHGISLQQITAQRDGQPKSLTNAYGTGGSIEVASRLISPESGPRRICSMCPSLAAIADAIGHMRRVRDHRHEASDGI